MNFTVEGLDGPLTEGDTSFTVTVKVDGEIPEGQYLYKIEVSKDGIPLEGQEIYYGDRLGPFATDADGVAWFGPPAGISEDTLRILEDTGVTTPFETDLEAGNYVLTLSLVNRAGGEEAILGQPAAHEFAVYDYDLGGIDVQFGLELDEIIQAGPCPFAITARVATAEGDAAAKAVPLRYKITVWKDGELLDGQAIKYPEAGQGDDPEDWSIFTVVDGVAWFGPGAGFTLTQLSALLGEDGVTTPFQADLAAGNYEIRLELVDVDNDVTWDEGQLFSFTIHEEVKSIAQAGDKLEFESGVVISIPGAASGRVSVVRYAADDKSAPAGMVPVGIYLSIECSEALHGQEARLEVSYDRDNLPEGVTEDDLRLYRYRDNRWVLIEDQGIDKVKGILWANLSGFSEFGIFADRPGTEVPKEEPKELPEGDMPETGGGLSNGLFLGLFMLLAGLWFVRETELQG